MERNGRGLARRLLGLRFQERANPHLGPRLRAKAHVNQRTADLFHRGPHNRDRVLLLLNRCLPLLPRLHDISCRWSGGGRVVRAIYIRRVRAAR